VTLAPPAGTRSSATRQRLIESAEHLFATRGIDAVSLAEITTEAGLNNTGAVHYHFGGREALLDAIVEQHRIGLDQRREQMFDQLEAGGALTVTALVRVLVEPLADQLDDPRGRAFLSIQAQRFQRPRPVIDAPRPVVYRFLSLIGTREIPREVAGLVTEFGRILVFGALGLRARVEAEGGAAALDRRAFVDHLVDGVVRLLEVPPGPRSSER
jgi:AcrR family transcriptional regulator